MRKSEVEIAKRRFQQDVDNALRKLLSDPTGRAFLWWATSEIGQASYVAGQFDATAYNEGRRSVMLRLEARAKQADFNGWLAMLAENTKPVKKPEEPRDQDAPDTDDL